MMKLLLVLVGALGVARAAVTCDECQAAVQDFASCIFNHFLVESDACGLAGLCYVRDWTCDECSMLMSQLAAFMTEEETIAEGVSYLQGECFCGQEGHTESCPDLVSGVVPLAMPVLAAALTEKTVEHCQEIVNVC